jgi:hypothetical protein
MENEYRSAPSLVKEEGFSLALNPVQTLKNILSI